MRKHRWCIAIGIIVLCCVTWVSAEELRVIGFNVESGGANPEVLDDLIARIDGVDLWGLSEVQNAQWVEFFELAAEEGEQADFAHILGTSGGGDRLLIVYDADRLELVRHLELEHINPEGRVRAPLVAQFRLRSTGQELLFVVNHLYRSRPEKRHEQARLLNQWAQEQTLPIIAVGDYNFDWDVTNGVLQHDDGYDLLTADGVFLWITPQPLIRTQCSFHSVLDFVFVANSAKTWPATSAVLEAQEDYCPDTDETSDHRPVLATFQLAASERPRTKALLLERIQRMEEELQALKALIERLQE